MFARTTTRLLAPERFLGQQTRTFANPAIKETKAPVDYSQYTIRTRNRCILFKIVDKGETGFIERFGKLNRLAEPGFNFTIPLIETIRKVTISRYRSSI